jgi:hypothetical protein
MGGGGGELGCAVRGAALIIRGWGVESENLLL